jgi:type IV pilus assembly protein PilY1
MAVGFSGVGNAEDTDIYLAPPSVDRDDAPLVLIVFDNSSSMAGNYIVSTVPFDPNTDPPYVGNFTPTQIYWRTSDQVEPTSPDTYPGQNFSAANNYCHSSGLPDAFGTQTPLSSAGFFQTRAASWKPGWSAITASDLIVDCEADNPADKYGSGHTKLDKSSTIDKYLTNGAAFNWTNGRSVVMYSGNYLNWKANPTSNPETRLSVAKRAVKNIIDANPGVKFGMMLFNNNTPSPHGGYVAMRMGRLDESVTYAGLSQTRRDALKMIVDDINPRPHPNSASPPPAWTNMHVCNPAVIPVPTDCSNTDLPLIGTPLAEALWEAKLYLSGTLPKYGYANADAIPEPDAAAVDPATHNYIAPFDYTCQQAYIIYVTDGNPWTQERIRADLNDYDADSDIAGLSGVGTLPGANADYGNNLSNKMDELAQWMYLNDMDSSLDKTQRVITYTVAFGLNSSDPDDAAGTLLLQGAAQHAGGTANSASDESTLTTALQNSLIEIQTTNSSFAAPSLSVNAFNKLYNRDEVYFALFKPSTTRQWDGNVKKFKLCANTNGNTPCSFGEIVDSANAPAVDPVTQRLKDTAVSYWNNIQDGGTVKLGGAGAEIPAPTSRKVYTYLGDYSGVTSTAPATLVETEAAAGNALYDAAVADPLLLSETTPLDAAGVTKIINWMNGQDTYDNDKDSDTTESRWSHADPLHSRPIAVTFGCEVMSAGKCAPDAAPIIKIFYGSNDGMLRMIDDSTGEEEWAFVPKELLKKQHNIALDSESTHEYGLDGTATLWLQDNNNNGVIEPEATTDATNPKGDKAYLYIGMRRGGKNIYALDVTPASTFASANRIGNVTPKLIWAIRGGTVAEGGDGNYLKLAQTWSKPAITSIRFNCTGNCDLSTDTSEVKTVLLFGGGYDSSEDDTAPVQSRANKVGNAIYMADPLNGSRIFWASDGADAAGNNPDLPITHMDFSIPSDLALMDSNADGETDRIYVGDTSGQLFRIDLGPTLRLNNRGNTTGFIFADVGCEGNTPATARPDCSTTLAQNRRKFFYPPDVAQVRDDTFEDGTQKDYDLVAFATGDREDPLDYLTAANPARNRIYAFRDRNIASLAGATVPSAPKTETNLFNATTNLLQVKDVTAGSDYQKALEGYTDATGTYDGIKDLDGWYIDIKEMGATAPTGAPTTWPWVGEKALAKAVIFDGALYITTYTPASNLTALDTCSATEGSAKLYALNYLSGAAQFDYNKDGQITTADRSMNLGGGIPSELITVIREGGTSALVGTSGGAAQPEVKSDTPRFTTFWYEE